MTLKIVLKENEKIILGGALVRNGNQKTELFIENRVSLLREKNIMKNEEATTPCRKVYYVIQLMYLDPLQSELYHSDYWGMVHEIVKNAPSTVFFLDRINEFVFQEQYYQALKTCANLIRYEKELMSDAKQSVGEISMPAIR